MQDAPRRPYRREEMRRLVDPASIAVIGASERPASLGLRTMRNLASFKGDVMPVNARYDRVLGRRCYASIDALPSVPDAVVIALPKEHVESTVRECAARGVGGVVVFASGYAETQTADGMAAQRRLRDIARDSGMRIVGPNTTGIGNNLTLAHLGFAEFPHARTGLSGTIGLVTQSGALGLGLSQAAEHGASFSHVLTAGNSCDVDVADHVAYLAEEPGCRAIALVFEGLVDARRLAEAAKLARGAGKRIVAYKLATSPLGREAALRHSGSDAGSDADYDRLFAAEGIVRARRSETVVEDATFFAKVSGMKPGPRTVGVVSSSGGTAIMAADMASIHEIAMPQPTGRTLAEIKATIPSYGAAANPCDATAAATGDPEMLRRTTEAFFADPGIGAVVVPWGKAYASTFLPEYGRLAARHQKPACLVWMSQWLEGIGSREIEAEPHVAMFRSMDACFGALAAYFDPQAPR